MTTTDKWLEVGRTKKTDRNIMHWEKADSGLASNKTLGQKWSQKEPSTPNNGDGILNISDKLVNVIDTNLDYDVKVRIGCKEELATKTDIEVYQ